MTRFDTRTRLRPRSRREDQIRDGAVTPQTSLTPLRNPSCLSSPFPGRHWSAFCRSAVLPLPRTFQKQEGSSFHSLNGIFERAEVARFDDISVSIHLLRTTLLVFSLRELLELRLQMFLTFVFFWKFSIFRFYIWVSDSFSVRLCT